MGEVKFGWPIVESEEDDFRSEFHGNGNRWGFKDTKWKSNYYGMVRASVDDNAKFTGGEKRRPKAGAFYSQRATFCVCTACRRSRFRGPVNGNGSRALSVKELWVNTCFAVVLNEGGWYGGWWLRPPTTRFRDRSLGARVGFLPRELRHVNNAVLSLLSMLSHHVPSWSCIFDYMTDKPLRLPLLQRATYLILVE